MCDIYIKILSQKDVKRSKNYKQSEIDILISCFEPKKNIIECKKSDTVTQREKDLVWLKIEKKFNAESGVYHHDWKTLKSKYDNPKKTSKSKWADDNKYVLGIGGGPIKKTPPLNETDGRLC